jgi:23S rRNA pseudouridine955/2504/2580 synthase
MKTVAMIPVRADDGDVRLDRFIRRRFPELSQGQIEKLIRTGQVRVDGARAKAADRVSAGQTVRVPPLPDPAPKNESGISAKDAAFIQSLVIHRDADVIILNKPQGLAVQGGTKTTRHVDALLPALKFEREDKPKLIHRLDKDTSGILVLARHPAAAAHLSNLFRGRTLNKVYWAIVLGSPRPPEGQIRGWLRKMGGPKDADRELVQRCLQQDEGAVHAITDYAMMADAGQRLAWMALRPVTGRTHQLRFHMAEIGHAILGDPKYTCDRPTPGELPAKLHLHARAIELPQDKGKALRIVAPLPPHMKETFEALGLEESDGKNPFAAFP